MFRQILICSLVCILVATVYGGLAGGLSEVKNATTEVQDLVDHVKADLEERLHGNYWTFKAVSFRTQIVAGTNYFIKVDTGCDIYVHVRIFDPFPAPTTGPILKAYQLDKTFEDTIEYFNSTTSLH